jgi:RNA polymerase primary sigma factor
MAPRPSPLHRAPTTPRPLGSLTDHRLLSSREERRLATRARRGDPVARGRLVECNIRLVYKIASEYLRDGLDLDDLVQDGVIGLMRAIDKFEPERGNRLSTYATWWIRQAITRALASQSRTIRLPSHAHEQARVLARTTQQLAATFGRAPTREERADALGVSITQVEAIDRADQGPVSFSAPIGEGDSDLGTFIADESDVADTAERALLGEAVRQLLDHLSPREQKVLRLRFGLGGGEPRTLEDVAREFGISQERVRQLERRALGKLRPLALYRLGEYAHDGPHA